MAVSLALAISLSSHKFRDERGSEPVAIDEKKRERESRERSLFEILLVGIVLTRKLCPCIALAPPIFSLI